MAELRAERLVRPQDRFTVALAPRRLADGRTVLDQRDGSGRRYVYDVLSEVERVKLLAGLTALGAPGPGPNSPPGSQWPAVDPLIVAGRAYTARDGVIFENGVELVGTAYVTRMFELDGSLWQQTPFGFWQRIGNGWSQVFPLDPRSPAPPTDPLPPPPSGRTLKNEIHFTSPDDLRRGRILDAKSGTGGYYDPRNVLVANGELLVRTDGKGSNANFQLPDFAQTYGRWEWRVRMDRGGGCGPAVLLWPVTNNWPADGEIDVYETMGHADRYWMHNHWGSVNSHQSFGDEPIYADTTQWLDIAVEWYTDRIVGYQGTKQVFTQTGRPGIEIPNGPMFPCLQTDGPTQWMKPLEDNAPESMYLHVDSLRVYS